MDSLKVDIQTRTGETGSEKLFLYIIVFRTGSAKDCLKFQTTLHKITKEGILNTVPQMNAITKNLLEG